MSKAEVAIAILYRQGRFLLQLRDDNPAIVYPGQWALFGGHVEFSESTDDAIRRELLEEIGYAPPILTKVGRFESDRVIRTVYQGALDVDLSDLVQMEGWDMALLTPADIYRGHHYSARANQVRSIAAPPRKILLDFIAETPSRWG